MKSIEWSGYTWITQERWGQIHHNKPDWWYDADAVSIDEYGYMHLQTKYKPQTFEEINDAVSNISAGLISCTSHEFHWGTYEIEAKLPTGPCLWPAFWMWSWDTWPPEIDIFEAYSNNHGSYFKWNSFAPWNVQTNVHYIDSDTFANKMIGGKRSLFTLKSPSKRFIKYRVEWKKDSIKFYYNNFLVRAVKDSKILNAINNTHMNVILNNGITKYLGSDTLQNSDFIIKYFKYTQLK